MSNPYEDFDEHSNEEDLKALLDTEYDEVQQLIDDQIVRNRAEELKNIDEYFGNSKFRVEKDDPRTNLFEQGGKYRRVMVADECVPQSFQLIDVARKAGIKQHWTEKQMSGQDVIQARPACIMLDLDIYQIVEQQLCGENHMHRFIHDAAKLFISSFDLKEKQKGDIVIFAAIFKRAKITYDEGHQAWKDGYHIGIYARVKRDEKRFLVHQILEKKILTTAFGKCLQLKDTADANVEKILDTACCHVPPLLYGSNKAESTVGPYKLWLTYQIRIEEDGTCFITKDDRIHSMEKSTCHTLEFSYNFDGKIIKKLEWVAKSEYSDTIMLMNGKAGKTTTPQEREQLMDELHSLLLNDPDAEYLKNVLDCLKPERYNNRSLWFKVVYALVKDNERYIPLAKWFSKKSHKYDDVGFMKVLEDVARGDYKINHESIYYWASQDAPEAYKACNDKSCFLLMSKFVFDNITEGKLNHAHYAELIWMFLKNKYKTDMKGKQRVWYEFIFPNDQHEKGQVYKWVELQSPDSLDLYLHRKLTDLCNKMIRFLSKKIKEAEDALISRQIADKHNIAQEKRIYNSVVQLTKNFKSSARGLWADGFKGGVLKQAEKVFQEKGFARSLDQGEMDLGVGNGVLVLSWDGKLPKLVRSYNTCKVSRYTNTPYKQFDPKDPLTRKLLKGLRAMHTDNQTDAYEYKMAFKAATLDNRPRETIILLITGPGSNGKSFEFELHGATLGEMYCAQMPIALLLQSKEDNGEAPKPFFMKLEAARCAYYEEGPTCAVLYMPVVKRITGCGNMPGRNLYGEARTIKSRCYHFVLSNHDFIVLSHEEAVWRRLRYLYQSVIFKDELEFDNENPIHRLMDRSFNAQFIENEDTRSAYMSILVFFHMKLMKYHGGVIEHVPHPTIDEHTLKFRNRQDTLNKFISERVVISPAQTDPIPIDQVVDAYCLWYDANIRQIKHYKQEYVKQLADSALKDVIDQNVHGSSLQKGFRIMNAANDIGTEEKPFTRAGIRSGIAGTGKKYSSIFPKENLDEYLERVEREWDDLLSYSLKEDYLGGGIDMARSYDYTDTEVDTEDTNIDDKAKTERLKHLTNVGYDPVESENEAKVGESAVDKIMYTGLENSTMGYNGLDDTLMSMIDDAMDYLIPIGN